MEQLKLMGSFGIEPTGILHVGANTGQEFETYRQSGTPTVVYVEPVDRVFTILDQKVSGEPGHHAVKAVCSDRPGDVVTFNIASNSGASSSMLPMGEHATLYPDVFYVAQQQMVTTTVDELVAARFPDADLNLLVLDVQGAEMKVLQGATETLKGVDAIYTEVAEAPLYEGGCTWAEIMAFLEPLGFRLKVMKLGRKNWGDAFFVRNSAITEPPPKFVIERPGVDLARERPASQSSRSEWSRPDDPQGAVNGRVTGSHGFHTGEDDVPWWQVDLGTTTVVDEVMVFNRLGTGQERAYDFVLKVAADDGEFRTVHSQGGVPFGGADGDPARVRLASEKARYVRIELPHRGYLHLDAVEVYGRPVD